MYLSQCHILRSPSLVRKAGEQNFDPKWLYLMHLGFAVLMSLQTHLSTFFKGAEPAGIFPLALFHKLQALEQSIMALGLCYPGLHRQANGTTSLCAGEPKYNEEGCLLY